jgi:hypothetical protein
MGVGYVQDAIEDDAEEHEKSPNPQDVDDEGEYIPPAPSRRGLRRRS